ncbi:hypothetical protein SAMN02745166_03980 [Prosthecobacter debontii]|uniref:DUF5362 domain-containing protein n=1 Tax=Prosthecobacter debontii TaxID=48467 RepID=A0A1T4YQS2_9BACT|nr:DUF5362 family protein [Prosthecobacter debontii]SKB04122.1 hypothetical protein SAMN02745166_03980 [Prosthecobacter debontii]
MESNPYNTPSANLFGSTHGTAVEGVPAEAIVQLQRTKPWLRLIGVVMWIAVGLMLLGALGVVAAAAIGAGEMMKGQTGAFGGVPLIGVAVLYALMSLIYIYPTVKIWKYGTCIGRLSQSRNPEDLVAALNQQRAFWKFAGILLILMILLYVVVIIGAVVFSAAAAGGLQNIPVEGAGTENP